LIEEVAKRAFGVRWQAQRDTAFMSDKLQIVALTITQGKATN